MKRLMPSLTFAGLLASACSWGAASVPPPMPPRDPQVMAIVLQNDAVRTMLTGRKEDNDYWIRIDYVDRYREAPTSGSKPIAMVNIYFDPPISYSGVVPTESNPCHGHYNDDSLDPGDPCMKQTPTYGEKSVDFTKSKGIVAEVDLVRDEVVEVFESGYTPDELADVKSLYGTPKPIEEQ